MKNLIKEFQTFEIDFPLVQGDTDIGHRCALLKAVQKGLMMHNIKAFKGKDRRAQLSFNLMAVARCGDVYTELLEAKINASLEETIKQYDFLPNEILSKVENKEDLFFGEYSTEIYEMLKEYFYAEKRALKIALS